MWPALCIQFTQCCNYYIFSLESVAGCGCRNFCQQLPSRITWLTESKLKVWGICPLFIVASLYLHGESKLVRKMTFDLGRTDGYPTRYGDQHSPAHADVFTSGLITAFLILGVALFAIIPAYSSLMRRILFCRIFFSLFIGGVILGKKMYVYAPLISCLKIINLTACMFLKWVILDMTGKGEL